MGRDQADWQIGAGGRGRLAIPGNEGVYGRAQVRAVVERAFVAGARQGAVPGGERARRAVWVRGYQRQRQKRRW